MRGREINVERRRRKIGGERESLSGLERREQKGFGLLSQERDTNRAYNRAVHCALYGAVYRAP